MRLFNRHVYYKSQDFQTLLSIVKTEVTKSIPTTSSPMVGSTVYCWDIPYIYIKSETVYSRKKG